MMLAAVIQARMTSTRLAGKILKEVLGKPLLEYELERVARIKGLDEVVVATTANATDDPVVELCKRLGVKYFRGSELDVLDRYHQTAQMLGARSGDCIARITADCPLIDPGICSEAIDIFMASRHTDQPIEYMDIDYETLPHGVDIELCSFDALESAHRDGHDQLDREHVTWYIRHRPELFRHARYSYKRACGSYRLTVDTPEDFALVKSVIEALYPRDPRFTFDDVIDFLDSHDDIRKLNEDIEQRLFIKGKNL